MRNFQEKKGWRNVMQSKPALVLLGIVVLAFAWSVVGLVGKMRETVKNKTIVEDKIAELQQTKEKLSADIEKLKTEKGVEESIREKFGWVKEGEGVIVVVEDNSSNQTGQEPESSGGFFSWLKNLLK